MPRAIWLVILALYLVPDAKATTIKRVSLHDLFREADVVAIVYVSAGDTAAYRQAVYRAEVVEAIKGTNDQATVYFGPYSGYKVGGEYVAFLRRTTETVGSMSKGATAPWPSADRERLLTVMYAGYRMLPAEYTCLLEDCADGVSIVRHQVLLPSELSFVDETCGRGSKNKSWVLRDQLLNILRMLAPDPALRRRSPGAGWS